MIKKIRLSYIKLLMLAFLKLIRFPNLLIIILTQYFTRIFLIGPKQKWLDHITDFDLFLLSLSTILVASAGYIINDYYDIKIDIINRPKRIVVGRILKRRTAMGMHIVLNVLGILIGAFLSIKVAVINIFAGFLLWFYSNYLKRLPFIGNFIVALLTTLVIGILAVYFQQNTVLIYTFVVFVFFISLIREIIKDLADMKGDIVFGCKTLPIIWGIRKTKYLLYGLTAIFIAALFSFIMLHFQWCQVCPPVGGGNGPIDMRPPDSQYQMPLAACFFTIILISISWFIFKLVSADTKQKYNYLSAVCKFIMLSGIIGMAVI